MAERNADVPEDRRMLFRFGINLGDVLIQGDDILGDGVNVAARLEGIAEPGGICVSDNVYQQVRASSTFRSTTWETSNSRTSRGRCESIVRGLAALLLARTR